MQKNIRPRGTSFLSSSLGGMAARIRALKLCGAGSSGDGSITASIATTRALTNASTDGGSQSGLTGECRRSESRPTHGSRQPKQQQHRKQQPLPGARQQCWCGRHRRLPTTNKQCSTYSVDRI
eukprot:6179544-Pleurochrysis_carterae.AAC.3